MKNAIRKMFASYIYDDLIYLVGNKDTIPHQYISVDDFCNLFGEIEEVTLEKLIQIDEERDWGYKDFFQKIRASEEVVIEDGHTS